MDKLTELWQQLRLTTYVGYSPGSSGEQTLASIYTSVPKRGYCFHITVRAFDAQQRSLFHLEMDLLKKQFAYNGRFLYSELPYYSKRTDKLSPSPSSYQRPREKGHPPQLLDLFPKDSTHSQNNLCLYRMSATGRKR
jgi:hypothetical protein